MVSILTVMFLMILLSVFTVALIKIVSDEQRQSTDNDLAASALIAAQSGIEDGKRLLIYCATNTSPECTQMMSSGAGAGDCGIFRNAGTLRGALGIQPLRGDVIVGSAPYQQSYTCLTINGIVNDITIGDLEVGKSVIKAVSPSGAMASMQLSWSGGVGANYASRTANQTLHPEAEWKAGNDYPWAPVLRAQFIPYQPGSVDLDQSELYSKTVYILPGGNTPDAGNIIGVDDRNTVVGGLRTSSSLPIVYARCSTPSGNQGFACSKRLSGFRADRLYYVRLTPIYGSIDTLKIQALDASGTTLSFASQPTIDVTGKANDVFKRVQARVSQTSPRFTAPEFVLETANTVCKNMTVTDTVSTTKYGCDPLIDNNTNIDGNPGIGKPPGGGNTTPCWKRFGWNDDRCWSITVTNYSTSVGDSVIGCRISWGDVSPGGGHFSPGPSSNDYYTSAAALRDYCQQGRNIKHTVEAPYRSPVGTFKNYSIQLFIKLKDGSVRGSPVLNYRRPR